MNTHRMKNAAPRRTRVRGSWVTAILALAALPLAGCSDILEVKDPDIIPPADLQNEAGFETLRLGAIGDFNWAFVGAGGVNDGLLMFAGMVTDEWDHSGTFRTRQEAEAREISLSNSVLEGVFRRMHRARAAAEFAREGITEIDADDARVPEMAAYAGFSLVAFAENFCSGVPLSKMLDDGSFEFGQPLTRMELLALAETRLTEGYTHAGVSSDIESMARVLLGRAMLNMDNPDYAAAAALMSPVSTGYMKLSEHDFVEQRNRNSIYDFNRVFERWTVADLNGTNGLPFRSANDPRVPVNRSGGTDVGFDGQTEQWDLMLYSKREDPVRLVTGVEARLIEAELALQDGRPGDMVAILADLRDHGEDNYVTPLAEPTGDPWDFSQIDLAFSLPVADQGSFDANVDLLFQERAYWLFSTGHRLGDMRRLIREYGRVAEDIFPVGTHPKGFARGTDVNLPVIVSEENNPNFSGCLDRNP